VLNVIFEAHPEIDDIDDRLCDGGWDAPSARRPHDKKDLTARVPHNCRSENRPRPLVRANDVHIIRVVRIVVVEVVKLVVHEEAISGNHVSRSPHAGGDKDLRPVHPGSV